MADDTHEAQDGFFAPPEDGFAASVKLPTLLLPDGMILITEAIRSFCGKAEGRATDEIPVPKMAEIAEPVRKDLINGRVRVTCLAHDGSRLDVEPTAFIDWGTWYAAFCDPNSLQPRPGAHIKAGYLIVDRSQFLRVTSAHETGGTLDVPRDGYVPPIIAYMLELVRRFGIVPEYKFNRKAMADEIFALAAKEMPHLGISVTDASYLSSFIGNPEHSSGGRTSERKGKRKPEPRGPHKGITYPIGEHRVEGIDVE